VFQIALPKPVTYFYIRGLTVISANSYVTTHYSNIIQNKGPISRVTHGIHSSMIQNSYDMWDPSIRDLCLRVSGTMKSMFPVELGIATRHCRNGHSLSLSSWCNIPYVCCWTPCRPVPSRATSSSCARPTCYTSSSLDSATMDLVVSPQTRVLEFGRP
jgi:hypothetical protein